MGKPLYQILIEGIVVGQLLIWVYYITKFLILENLKDIVDFTKNESIILFLSGFLFHILCEVTGVNVWYATHYYKLLEGATKTI